jgi:hypothetical protein
MAVAVVALEKPEILTAAALVETVWNRPLLELLHFALVEEAAQHILHIRA